MSIISRSEVRSFVSDLDSDSYNSLIDVQIPLIEEFITNYCNYHFTKYEEGYIDLLTYFDCMDLTFAATGSTITDNNDEVDFSSYHKFAAGDNIYIKGSLRNDGHYDIKTITDTIITVGDLYSLENETSEEDYTIYIFMVKWPKALKLISAQMIEYNLLRKYNTDKNIKSEHIGDYSVSFDSKSESYPSEILMGLNEYKRVDMK